MNPQASAELLQIELKGVASLSSKAGLITLAGNPDDTDSLSNPRKVVPVTTTLREVQPVFTQTLPPHSVIVLKLKEGR